MEESKKQSLKTEHVVEEVFAYIINNRLGLHDKLPSEEEFAEHLGASRVCIREAMRGLKFLGLIETGTRRGTRIRELDFNLLTRILGFQIAISKVSYCQLLEARLSLELGVLELISGKITVEQIAELRSCADCSRNGDTPEEIEHNRNMDCLFHRTLFAISGNAMMSSFSRLLEIFFSNLLIFDKKSSIIATQEHFEIVNALEDKNLELARGIMRSHLSRYGKTS